MRPTLEKVVAWIAVIGFVATVVWAYANLNNRLDNMGNEMAGIKQSLSSAACNAILPREIEAIEKNHKDAREALERLSAQYQCGLQNDGDTAANWTGGATANVAMNATARRHTVQMNSAQLNAELNDIDRKQNEDPFANTSR